MTIAPVEEGFAFDCSGEILVGIMHRPGLEISDIGVLIIVGGPQYRAGSHRQFTLLSRALAVAGYPVLRFDYRGMGDSSGRWRGFDEISKDIDSAISAAEQLLPQVRGWVLWGLCDGASAALLYCHKSQDERVRGLCLVNPWVRTPEGLARTRVKHYYAQRLIQRDFWRKLFTGRVARRAVSDLLLNLRMAGGSGIGMPVDCSAETHTFDYRMAQAWARFPGPILLLLSGEDFVALEFIEHARRPEWQVALSRPNLTRIDLAGANHTFSSSEDRNRAEAATLAWLMRWAPGQVSNV
jgi:exosortase A-associated hydrolase 1